MIAVDRTAQEVARLADMIPGVKVLGCEISASGARLRVAAAEPGAVDALQRAALAANVSIEPWLKDLPLGTSAEQTISAQCERRDELEFGELQILGIHLVWHLKNTGLMASVEANTMLSKWGAASVGA